MHRCPFTIHPTSLALAHSLSIPLPHHSLLSFHHPPHIPHPSPPRHPITPTCRAELTATRVPWRPSTQVSVVLTFAYEKQYSQTFIHTGLSVLHPTHLRYINANTASKFVHAKNHFVRPCVVSRQRVLPSALRPPRHHPRHLGLPEAAGGNDTTSMSYEHELRV